MFISSTFWTFVVEVEVLKLELTQLRLRCVCVASALRLRPSVAVRLRLKLIQQDNQKVTQTDTKREHSPNTNVFIELGTLYFYYREYADYLMRTANISHTQAH